MRYTVTFCNDPYLLARLFTDLRLCGVTSCDWHNKEIDPFLDSDRIACYEDGDLMFINHSGVGSPIRLNLTEKNYTKVLTEILKP